MPFKQMLTIEHLNDELLESTNEDYAPNAGDKYSQLGDSATVAVLDGAARAMLGLETFVLRDCGPNVGDFAWSFFCACCQGLEYVAGLV
ncbi:MAG: hypothetical protein ACKPKO_06235, partial [Candidatus Fonsibacter sp.]